MQNIKFLRQSNAISLLNDMLETLLVTKPTDPLGALIVHLTKIEQDCEKEFWNQVSLEKDRREQQKRKRVARHEAALQESNTNGGEAVKGAEEKEKEKEKEGNKTDQEVVHPEGHAVDQEDKELNKRENNSESKPTTATNENKEEREEEGEKGATTKEEQKEEKKCKTLLDLEKCQKQQEGSEVTVMTAFLAPSPIKKRKPNDEEEEHQQQPAIRSVLAALALENSQAIGLRALYEEANAEAMKLPQEVVRLVIDSALHISYHEGDVL